MIFANNGFNHNIFDFMKFQFLWSAFFSLLFLRSDSQQLTATSIVYDSLGYQWRVPAGWTGMPVDNGYLIQEQKSPEKSIVLLKNEDWYMMSRDTVWNDESYGLRRASPVKFIGDSIKCARFEAIEEMDTIPIFIGVKKLGWNTSVAAITFSEVASVNFLLQPVVEEILISAHPAVVREDTAVLAMKKMLANSRLFKLNAKSKKRERVWIDLGENEEYVFVPGRLLGYNTYPNGDKYALYEESSITVSQTRNGVPIPPPPPPMITNGAKTPTKSNDFTVKFEPETREIYQNLSEHEYGRWTVRRSSSGGFKLILTDPETGWKGYSIRMKGDQFWLNEEPYALVKAHSTFKPAFLFPIK